MSNLRPDMLDLAAKLLRNEFRENYRRDPEFRATFNKYLLDEFGIHVVSDEPPRTLQTMFDEPVKH